MNMPKQNGAEISIYKKQSDNVSFQSPIQKALMSYRIRHQETRIF